MRARVESQVERTNVGQKFWWRLSTRPDSLAPMLQPVPILIKKVIELYETKNSRHSAMIVGHSNTGKSATWQVLKNTLTSMNRLGRPGFYAVQECPLNPKALNRGELYGECNLAPGGYSGIAIWSLCASVDESGRQKTDSLLRELEGASFPLRDTVYEYYVDVRQRSFASWEEKLSPKWKFAPG
ncbi:hypothetical protein QAD02_002039 [Eretmocerus hayati]|uniref:Uncharacterized protein n=1 Tax=Eretmocerus hayati TaxID=131215 RepID=A0ACC2NHT6_9HYME|nr:hypothetical protein QAD02_002039 [Eretmocerus hayati]